MQATHTQPPSGMNTNVFDYLERLPPEALDKLYGKDAGASTHGQWTCRALLQSLPQLAKQHVMRLLFVEGFVDKGMLKSWVKKEYQRVHAVSMRKVCPLPGTLCVPCTLLDSAAAVKAYWRSSSSSNSRSNACLIYLP